MSNKRVRISNEQYKELTDARDWCKLRISNEQYKELTDARDWCKLNDYTGFAQWYNELLADGAKRRSLPLDAVELRDLADERPSREDRDRGGRDDNERSERPRSRDRRGDDSDN